MQVSKKHFKRFFKIPGMVHGFFPGLLVPFEGFSKKNLTSIGLAAAGETPSDREELELEHLTVMPVPDANESGDPKDIAGGSIFTKVLNVFWFAILSGDGLKTKRSWIVQVFGGSWRSWIFFCPPKTSQGFPDVYCLMVRLILRAWWLDESWASNKKNLGKFLVCPSQSPKSSILIGFFTIFTIHFGVPLF